MPNSPPRVCVCSGLIRDGVCSKCGPRKGSTYQKPEYHKLYNLRAWRRGRLLHLAASPLCVVCEKEGIVRPAIEVDHIVPHRGDMDLFLDPSNWQSLCKYHSTSKSGRERGT